MDKVRIGAWIKGRRGQINITQSQLSERLSARGAKFASSTIGWWETGRGLPPLSEPAFIEALAESLEVSITDLLEGLGIYLPGGKLKSEDLSPLERELLDAYRRGDFQELMRIASKKPNTIGT